MTSSEPGGNPGHFSEGDRSGDWALSMTLLPLENPRASIAFDYQANQLYTLETKVKLGDSHWIPIEEWTSPRQSGRHAFILNELESTTGFFRIRRKMTP